VLAAALLCLACAPAASAAVLLDDGFEGGTFAAWSSVQTGGDGAALVQSQIVNAGAGAARLSETATSGSFARVRKTFSPALTTLVAEADFRVLAEGASGGNVPIFRLFDTAGTRVFSLFRQNLTGGKLSVNYNGAFFATTGVLPQDAWRHVTLRVVVDGAFSTVQVSVDGASVYSTTGANLGTNAVGTLQLGNEVGAQRFDLVVDGVTASDDSGDPPPPPPPPPPPEDTTPPETTIDSGPAATTTTGSATFAFSSNEAGSSFACRLDAGTWEACASPHSVSGLGNGEHTLQVRATDAAGNTDATPAERTWTVALPSGTCDPSLPAPTTTDPGTVAIADSFENGFWQWTEAVQEGDATATIQSDTVKRGRCALKLSVTTSVWSSRANLAKVMPDRTNEIWADGWFNTLQDGADPSWNTPTFRFLSLGKRVLDVSRQNGNGQMFIRYPNPAGGWSFGYGNRLLALNRWYRIKIHVVADGNLSTVEVWLDGTLVYRNAGGVTLGVEQLDVTLAGAEHQNQEGVVAVDDVVVKSLQPPLTPRVFDDGFESANFADWTTVQTGGDGTATVDAAAASSGSFGARLTATANAGSLANVRKTLRAAVTDLTTKADVKVLSEGAAGGNTPLLQVNDAGGVRLVTVVRLNGAGDRIAVQYGASTYTTTGTLPLGAYKTLELRTITFGAGAGTVAVSLDGNEIYRSTTASIGSTGVKTLLLGATTAGKGFSFVADRVTADKGTAGPTDDPRYKLLVADYLNKRLLITDFQGRVVWKMDNPSGNDSFAGGPIGVRWLPNNQILLTCGTGEVGVVDVATKKWVWQVKGFNGEAFESPYDAELLPDGRLAVALRFNSNGRVSVYDRATGQEVWRHLVPEAHSVGFRTAAQSYNSSMPTILIGGFGNIKEVTYNPGGTQAVTWNVRSEYTHDAQVVENDRVLTTEGYYIQKIDRAGTKLWKRSTPDENRRIAMNPNFGGGYIFTVGEGDRIEFRDTDGNLLREFSRLSDDTVLDYPYGIQVIDYPG
jgi:hypothetical protein